jgi:thiazolinyl imide reductase
MAFAAMGASGEPAVLELIERGVHVLCEHPQPPKFLKTALARAAARERCFHVNSHLALLPAGDAFLRQCHSAAQVSQPQFLDVIATDRSLYAVVDLLRSALGGLHPFQFRSTRSTPPFITLKGRFGSLPTTFRIQISRRDDGSIVSDGSPEYLADCRITLASRGGVLSLLSANGPVVWNVNAGDTATPKLWSLSGEKTAPDPAKFFRQRVRATLEAASLLARNARTGENPALQSSAHILDVSEAWQHLCERSARILQ